MSGESESGDKAQRAVATTWLVGWRVTGAVWFWCGGGHTIVLLACMGVRVLRMVGPQLARDGLGPV